MLIFLSAFQAAKLSVVLDVLRLVNLAQAKPAVLVIGYFAVFNIVQLLELYDLNRIGWLDILDLFDRILAFTFIVLAFSIDG